MVDNVSVMDQVHELQILVSKLKDVKVEVPESLQVGGIIAKLPPSWNGYMKKLLHTTETFSFEQIQKHLRIEEETRLRANKFSNESTIKVNFVEGKQMVEETRENFLRQILEMVIPTSLTKQRLAITVGKKGTSNVSADYSRSRNPTTHISLIMLRIPTMQI